MKKKAYKKRRGKWTQKDLLTALELRGIIKKFRVASVAPMERPFWSRVWEFLRGRDHGKYFYVAGIPDKPFVFPKRERLERRYLEGKWDLKKPKRKKK